MTALLLLWALVVGCARTGSKASAPDPGPAPPPAPDPVDLVEVEAPREFRAVWVATVFNLDFPSRAGMSPAAARSELSSMVDGFARRGLNAIILQVRSECDALYASELEPWSRYLSGRQGTDPGYDPLQTLIELAHDRGIEVHAWFNPYRAGARVGVATHERHISRWAKEHLVRWGPTLWLDPGAPKVQDHAVAVVADVLERYDIDGVHLDDYFYPYPRGRKAFPDNRTFQAYRSGGGTLSRADWRRSNVDALVERIWTLVREECPECRMGISPFGLYRPGHPPGTTGMDQVTALYADPLAWHREGWMDYVAPQLYWPTTKRRQAYGALLTYWDDHVTRESPVVVGIDATKAGKSGFSLAEYRKQVRLAREAPHTDGQIWFRAKPILKNQAGLGDLLTELYEQPALPLASRHVPPPAPPEVEVEGGRVELAHPDPDALRTYVVYRAELAPSTTTTFERFTKDSTFELPAGTWAISAVVRGSRESQGVRVTVH